MPLVPIQRTSVIFILLLAFWTWNCESQTWSYSAASSDWGGYCANGTIQSPIDIRLDVSSSQRSQRAPVELQYSTSAQLRTERTSVGVEQITIPAGSNISINGTQYKAVGMHWHTPAEHAFNGTRAVAELHIVHNDTANKPAVLSISYSRGNQSDPLLQLFLDNVPPYVPQGQASNGSSFGPIDLQAALSRMLPGNGDGFFWTYTGSLTTPPCSEGVKWYVSTKLAQLTDSQIVSFEEYANGGNFTLATNSRPVQSMSPSISVQPL